MKQGEVGSREITEADAVRDLLTVDQEASYLHLSTSSIHSYIRQGSLKAFRIAGKRKVLIPRVELLTLLQPARTTDSPSSCLASNKQCHVASVSEVSKRTDFRDVDWRTSFRTQKAAIAGAQKPSLQPFQKRRF